MKVFSLFSGIGGFDIAAENLGHTIIGYCEIDKYAQSIYRKHFPRSKLWEDARLLDTKNLEDFDMLTAGFPCQPFSIAGKRRGFTDERGDGFDQIVRIAKEKRPGILLLENVKGLLSHNKGKTFASILCKMDELGYDVQWQCLNSKYFVPQNRERVFIIGYLRGREKHTRKIFPIREDEKTHPQKAQPEQKVEVCSTLTAGYSKTGLGSQTYVVAQCLTAGGHSGGLHSDMMVIIHDKSQGNRVYDPKGISQTLSANGGGWGAKTGMYLYNKKIRRLTPTECEALQGFPTNFTKHGIDEKGKTVEISDTQRYKCLGNAVTVPVVQHIMSKISITDELKCIGN